LVECNVVFNENDILSADDTAVIPGNALAEGEEEKDIQAPVFNIKHVDAISEVQPENTLNNPPNSIPFLSKPEISGDPPSEAAEHDTEPNLGRGQHATRKQQGAYKRMHKGFPPLEANIANSRLPDEDNIGTDLPEDDNGLFAELPPDFALVGTMRTEPQSIDEALHGPNAKEWQAALDYEINQLKKLRTWVIENLPAGESAILCIEVLKEK
jgi:hypothetical protein